MKIGVPQGTVLGPILFVTYMNSLLKLETGGSIISYADDTALIFNGENWEEAKNKVIRGLLIVKNWLENFKLTLNLTKTNYIAFSLTSANRPDYSKILIGRNEIKEVSQSKYLGIVIDQFLKWHPHIDYVSNKIRKLIYKFYLLREFLNKNVLTIVYKAFVESLIRYGILVWGGLYNNALYKLNVIQKYILKVIMKKDRLYPTKRLFSEQTSNIRSIYMTTICTFVYTHDTLKRYIDHNYDTRARINRNIQIPVNHCNLNMKCLLYIAPKVFNLLPDYVKNSPSRKRFNRECSGFVFVNYNRLAALFGWQ